MVQFARQNLFIQEQMDRAPREGAKLLDVSHPRSSCKTQALFIKKRPELEGERPHALIVTERRPSLLSRSWAPLLGLLLEWN